MRIGNLKNKRIMKNKDIAILAILGMITAVLVMLLYLRSEHMVPSVGTNSCGMIDQPHIYYPKEDSYEWFLLSQEERWDVCHVSAEEAASMTTRALIQSSIEHTQSFAYGKRALVYKQNAMRPDNYELLSRTDALEWAELHYIGLYLFKPRTFESSKQANKWNADIRELSTLIFFLKDYPNGDDGSGLVAPQVLTRPPLLTESLTISDNYPELQKLIPWRTLHELCPKEVAVYP